jgi:hypothetical protein
MRVQPEPASQFPSALRGSEGELVSIQVTVEPRLLEQLLEALATLPFPVNPQILSHLGDQIDVSVEFPAYAEQLDQVRDALAVLALPPDAVAVRNMLEDLQPH